MNRHSSTNFHLTQTPGVPVATFLTSEIIREPWVSVNLPAGRLDVVAFEGGSVCTRLVLQEHALGAAHMTVEQARALRDSLTDALAKADYVNPAQLIMAEIETRLAS